MSKLYRFPYFKWFLDLHAYVHTALSVWWCASILFCTWPLHSQQHDVAAVMQYERLLSVWWQEDPEIPFTEDDYRRRKSHPNFKEHISAEKMVIKYGKTVSLCELLPSIAYILCWASIFLHTLLYGSTVMHGLPSIAYIFCWASIFLHTLLYGSTVMHGVVCELTFTVCSWCNHLVAEDCVQWWKKVRPNHWNLVLLLSF